MKKMLKTNSGITLISLIITIIVMVVLAGVALAFSVGDESIFERIKESSFKTDVRTYQEHLADSKNAVIVKNDGVIPTAFVVTNAEGTGIKDMIPQEIKDEWEGKLEVDIDGLLYYIRDGLTPLEIKWSEELGLREYVQMEIDEYVDYLLKERYDEIKIEGKEQYFNDGAKWDELGNFVDLLKMKEMIQAKYPDAAVTLTANGVPISDETYRGYLERGKACNEMLKRIEESGLDTSSKTKVNVTENTTNETLKYVVQTCKEHQIDLDLPAYLNKVVNKINLAQGINDLMIAATTLQISEIKMDEYGEEVKQEVQITVGAFDGESVKETYEQMGKECKVMSKNDADKLFDYTLIDGESDLGEKIKIATITKYKGNAKNITVPGIIADSTTNEQIMVTTIGEKAFYSDKPNKWPVLKEAGVNEYLQELKSNGLVSASTYKDATLEDIQLLGKMFIGGDPSATLPSNLASITDKDVLTMELLFMMFQAEMGLTGKASDYFELGDRSSGDYEIYSFVIIKDDGVDVFKLSQLEKDKNGKIICNEAKEKVTLSQGITTIKSKAFGRNAINIIYFPESIEEVASDTFEDGSVNKIQTRMSETSFKGIDGWTYYDLFGTDEDWHQIVEFVD